MIITIYIIILSYFALGGIGFYFINRTKDRKSAKNNWIKYITYFFIIHIFFFSIVFNPYIFHYLSIVIIIVGLGEIIKLFKESGYSRKGFFLLSMLLFLIFCAGFLQFGRLEKEHILFTFLVLSIFDAFSQISGQLIGRKKIFPAISPGKTLEGLIGGTIIAIASSLLLKGLIGIHTRSTLILATGIVLFAFIGDVATSFYKRKYNVKDFSSLLPGHGGFLDRFDSLISAGAFVFAISLSGG
jgi:phosphatidate cytidylyltransferase